MVAHAAHLRSPDFLGEHAGPSLLQRTDQRFMASVLAQMSNRSNWTALAKTRAAEILQGDLRIYQPVHRVFHLAVAEAFCDVPGTPRLDGSKIESAGIVLRRLRQRRGRTFEEGWMRAGERIVGWRPLSGNPASYPPPFSDPDPSLRRGRSSGHPVLDEKLAQLRATGRPLTEAVAPMFVLPPAACSRVDRTLVYGLLPIDSQPTVEEDDEDTTFEASEIAERIPLYFRRIESRITIPRSNQLVDRFEARKPDMKRYVAFLQQVATEFGFVQDTEAVERLRDAIGSIRLNVNGVDVRASQHLKEAIDVLVLGQPGYVRMPATWPAVTVSQESRIRTAALGVYRERFSSVKSVRGKFDAPDARYVVRPFIRVRREDGCPPDLVWSQASRPFRVVPWYDSGPRPPVTVQLPAVTPSGLKKLKPNVAFQVPSGLFDLLNRNEPEDFLNGDAREKTGGTTLDWICGFNIPIITFCAFIVLFIIISLLNIIFWWLPFVKICIPIPSSWKEGQ